MNIDYAKIIEAANERKDALLRLNDLLQALPGHLAALKSVRKYAQLLGSQADMLDSEGRELVGEPGMRAIEKFERGLEGVYSNYLNLWDNDPNPLRSGNGKTVLANLEALAKE